MALRSRAFFNLVQDLRFEGEKDHKGINPASKKREWPAYLSRDGIAGGFLKLTGSRC